VKKDCHLDLWVDCELELRLRRLAEDDGRKLSAYMRYVLERHADNCEHGEEIKPAANSRESLSAVPDIDHDAAAEYWRGKYLKAIGR